MDGMEDPESAMMIMMAILRRIKEKSDKVGLGYELFCGRFGNLGAGVKGLK